MFVGGEQPSTQLVLDQSARRAWLRPIDVKRETAEKQQHDHDDLRNERAKDPRQFHEGHAST
jgi:hypothetical protein